MTRRTSESEWAHLLDTPPPVPQQTTSVESTVVVANSSAMLASAGVGVGGGAGAGAGTSAGIGSISSANRRAGKPARRRTRASRKAPTTLFNTDTNNFRAMVQQFTGFPSLQGEGQGHGLHLPSQQPPAMTFQNQFNQHQQQASAMTGGAPFPLPVQQQQVYLDEEHLFGFGSSSNEINPFMSGFSRGGSSSNANNNNNNNSNNDGNNNNDDENKQNLRSNMEYFSFDEFDRTNDRF